MNVDFLGQRPRWQHKGLCAGADPLIWFPKTMCKTALAKAKAICDTCPVKVECLEFALTMSNEEQHGIWAGTSAAERVRMRKAAGTVVAPGKRYRTVNRIAGQAS